MSAFLLAAILHAAVFGVESYPHVDMLREIESLPDPFLMRNGERVKTVEDWSVRRKEIIEMLLHYEYGSVPPPPGDVVAEDVKKYSALEGKAIAREFTLAMGPEPRFRMKAGLLLPTTGGPRFPVIIAIDPVWQAHVIPTARQVIDRGYAFAGLWYFDADNDTGNRKQGVYQHYPEYDWGTLAAWAWGCMRLTDYLCTLPEIDAAHMAVTGHSRTGKAALLAGALDERISLVAPHASGTGGAGALRIADKECETLAAITDPKRFYYWFCPQLRTFVGKEARLPFDQHFVKALVAPRALLSLEARDDQWSNPLGTQQTHQAAIPVFQFLGAPDRIAFHERAGGHDMTSEDWDALLDYADHIFFGKPLTRTYDQWPYPAAPKAFSWTAP